MKDVNLMIKRRERERWMDRERERKKGVRSGITHTHTRATR